MKKWQIAVMVAIGISFVTFIGAKDIHHARQAAASATPFALQEQLDQLFAPSEPSILVFYTEPEEFCCEGTRVLYEEIRIDSEDLIILLEKHHPCLFIDVNSLISDDRTALFSTLARYSVKALNSVVVVGEDGRKLKEFAPLYDLSGIIAYMRDLP